MKPLTVILATYESRCGYCDETIYENDEIVNCEGAWIHKNCATDHGYEVSDG